MRQYRLFPEDLTKPNHYELLGISPSATEEEIKEAYKRLKSIYQPDSLAIYSLFSREELEKTLRALDEAYQVLVNEKSRQAYNEELIQQGLLKPEEIYQKEPAAALKRDEKGFLQEEEVTQGKRSFPQEEDMYRGNFLRRMRILKQLELDDISKVIKISVETLKNIEADNYQALPYRAYLRGFIIEYARCLQLNPLEVANAYLKHYDEWTRKKMGR